LKSIEVVVLFEQPLRRRKSQPQRLAFGNMPVPGTKAGLVVSIGIAVVAFVAIPVARPFILGAIGVGALIGWFLWWLHSRE
jgi:hypothetical protein